MQALDEGAEGQDVGRGPGGEAARGLLCIERGSQRGRQPRVRRDDADAARRGIMSGQPYQQFGLAQARYSFLLAGSRLKALAGRLSFSDIEKLNANLTPIAAISAH